MVSEGVKIRAQIDTESAKGLLLINSGASVALLAFFPFLFDKPDFKLLAYAVIIALLFYQMSLVLAIVHNVYRRQCSLIWESSNWNAEPGTFFGCKLKKPRECFLGRVYLWSSIIAFSLGGIIVFSGGLLTLIGAPNIEESDFLMVSNIIWVTVVAASYVFIILGSLGMIAFATQFPFSTRIKDLVDADEKFLCMNGYTIWLLAWSLIIAGTLIQLVNFVLG